MLPPRCRRLGCCLAGRGRPLPGPPHRLAGNSRRHISTNARLGPGPPRATSAQPATPSPSRAALRRPARPRSPQPPPEAAAPPPAAVALRRRAGKEARRPHADWAAVAVRIPPANRLSMGRDGSSVIGPRCVSSRPIRGARRAAQL